MCGILSIINKKNALKSESLTKACSIIKHRGPDDEGFLTWLPGEDPVVWAGEDTHESTLNHWHYQPLEPSQPFKIGFGHRRLSIIDLSPMGHQPMLYPKAGLAITFNGEIYNYIEIRQELELSGHTFLTKSDTEVILHAWEQWGPACLNKFNGMFSMVILDYKKQVFYAVRDRFGVKPLYFFEGENGIYFASEIKQIKTSPDYKFQLNQALAHQFLSTGFVDTTHETFYTGIRNLPGGHFIKADLKTDAPKLEITKWYTLKPQKWTGNYEGAADNFRKLLIDAVKLRLRSDVKVGSCLSGGLDSSSIVCIAADLLKAQGDFAGQETVTACYDISKYDEWKFAEEVIKKTNAHPHQTFPSFTQLKDEIQSFLAHQDEPTGSTSQFSQWAVFKRSHEAGLKVMVDGQGADEQLAGYGGNDLPLYSGLLKKWRVMAFLDEAFSYKKEHGVLPYGFILNAFQLNYGKVITPLLPGKYHMKKRVPPNWLNNPVEVAPPHHKKQPVTLRENLINQIYCEPLPALLRYEDRNSMAWSIESRTPFMDYRLIEFNLGLPERYIYKRGVRKTILRTAMKNILPESITNRRDKMGFVTPEEVWFREEGNAWFREEILKTIDRHPTFFKKEAVLELIENMSSGKVPYTPIPWRILCFGRWMEVNG